MDSCASRRSGSCVLPLTGSGASPRWISALEPSESTNALKSRFGCFGLSAIGSPQIDGELHQAIIALHEQDRTPALAGVAHRLLEVLQSIDFGAVHRHY